MKIEVYTSITNEKDKPRSDIKVYSEYDKFKDPVMNAKIFKIMPHKFMDCDISIYMDGNIYLNIPVEQVVKEWLKDADMAFFRHYKSKNVDWEYKWVMYKFNRRSEVTKEVKAQAEHYMSQGLYAKNEMKMGGFIIRRHTPRVAEFNEAWWAEICRWSQRDQLSLPIVLGRFPDLRVNRIGLNIKTCPQLRYEDHLHFKT